MSLLETRTISLRIKQAQLQNDIVETLRSATHLKNMMIILLKRVYQIDERLYSLLLNPDVVRAVLYDRSGGKKAVLVKECKSLLSSMTKQNQDFYEQINSLAQQFDAKHIYKLVKALAGEFKGFYTKIKKGEQARPPRPQKLRTLSNAAISLDKERVSIKEKGLSIRVGKDLKLDIPMNLKAIDKLISLEKVISYRLCYDGRHVSINISYRKQVAPGRVLNHEKYAGIDLGVNNLSSILVYDEHTPSLVVSGKDFKAYNSAFNKKKAKLASQKDLISNRLSEIEAEVYEAIDDYEGGEVDQELCDELADWHQLRPAL
jgi:transposase